MVAVVGRLMVLVPLLQEVVQHAMIQVVWVCMVVAPRFGLGKRVAQGVPLVGPWRLAQGAALALHYRLHAAQEVVCTLSAGHCSLSRAQS